MYESTDEPVVSAAGQDDLLGIALEMLAAEGLDALARAFDALDAAGILPADDAAQPLLIEAVFHMLEALEQDLADARLHRRLIDLDPAIAIAAAELLFLANFPNGGGDSADLGDGALLLLAALHVAAGDRPAGIALIQEAELLRPSPRVRRAAMQMLLLVQPDADAVVQLLFQRTLDGRDQPELWAALPGAVARFPDMIDALALLMADELKFYTELYAVLHALCVAAAGDIAQGLALIEPIATMHSQSVMVQGAFFHLRSLLDPGNPSFDLESRFCTVPFETLDVLDGRSYLCCASFLPESVGDLAEQPWQELWNSDSAQAIRASILDGSFRFCNKTTCPKIASGRLPDRDTLASESAHWRDVIAHFRTASAAGPSTLNLAYDESCNLSCPSCRQGRIAANAETRARFDRLQDEKILPMLRHAKLVFVTGSGDPFASKNFRSLMARLGPDEFPDLRFQIMTNGMLFTPREWERFPSLHGRVDHLRISLDAATGPTHERLRRGARWPVMEANLAFASDLRAQGLIDRLQFVFTVQVDNYREMGAAIDLAHHYGADHVGFLRLTNWGTFTADEYARKAVFMPSHPDHADFLTTMQDPRLRDPIAGLNDLAPFVA